MIGPCATRRHEPAPPPQPTNQHPLSDADLWGKIRVLLERAGDAGSVDAQVKLARLLAEGVDGPSAARPWFERAAAAGNADAQAWLLHLEGRGVERDPTAAASLFERAAEQGHAAAQYNLGVSYGWGVGVERDRDLARLWLERAAGQKFAPAQPALTALGARRRAAPAMASASVDLDIDNGRPGAEPFVATPAPESPALTVSVQA